MNGFYYTTDVEIYSDGNIGSRKNHNVLMGQWSDSKVHRNVLYVSLSNNETCIIAQIALTGQTVLPQHISQ